MNSHNYGFRDLLYVFYRLESSNCSSVGPFSQNFHREDAVAAVLMDAPTANTTIERVIIITS